jgi:hypothetical protein
LLFWKKQAVCKSFVKLTEKWEDPNREN